MELQGKIINFLGDSITEGIGVNDQRNRYDNIIRREYGLLENRNYGVAGTRIAHQSVPSHVPRYDLCFCGRAYLMNPDADAVVVFGGVNDYIHGDAPFGTMDDATPATYCGAVNFLMNYLKTAYEGKPIVFITPAHMCLRGVTDSIVSPRPIKKPDSKPLKAYVEVIKDIGKHLDVPTLDLFEKFPIDPNDAEQSKRYTADGLHLNDEAHLILAKIIGDFLLSL